MFKQHVFQPSEFSSYFRARMSHNTEKLQSLWDRARNSVEHDIDAVNFNAVQTFITKVADVYFDFYPEPFVLPYTKKEEYMQMRLRQIPITMFEDIFQQTSIEDRPVVWHVYLYLTNCRHLKITDVYKKDDFGVPTSEEVAEKTLHDEFEEWKEFCNKAEPNEVDKLFGPKKLKSYDPLNMETTNESLKYYKIFHRINIAKKEMETAKNIAKKEMETAKKTEYKDAIINYIEIAGDFYFERLSQEQRDTASELKKDLQNQLNRPKKLNKPPQLDKLRDMAIIALKLFKEDNMEPEYRGVGLIDRITAFFSNSEENKGDNDKVKLERTFEDLFGKQLDFTAALENIRIKDCKLPPVQTDPQTYKENSTNKFSGNFLMNAVQGKFNYSFDEAFDHQEIFKDLTKVDEQLWSFLDILNDKTTSIDHPIFDKETVQSYQENVNNWEKFTHKGRVCIPKITLIKKGYATFSLSSTLNNMSTTDWKMRDKDDLVFLKKFKRFAYLCNVFTYNFDSIIDKTSTIYENIIQEEIKKRLEGQCPDCIDKLSKVLKNKGEEYDKKIGSITEERNKIKDPVPSKTIGTLMKTIGTLMNKKHKKIAEIESIEKEIAEINDPSQETIPILMNKKHKKFAEIVSIKQKIDKIDDDNSTITALEAKIDKIDNQIKIKRNIATHKKKIRDINEKKEQTKEEKKGDYDTLIRECDARIAYQDLISKRTVVVPENLKGDYWKLVDGKFQSYNEDDSDITNFADIPGGLRPYSFTQRSDTEWTCDQADWPLQHLGAIDFHKMESLYEYDIEDEIFDDIFLAFVDLITDSAQWPEIIYEIYKKENYPSFEIYDQLSEEEKKSNYDQIKTMIGMYGKKLKRIGRGDDGAKNKILKGVRKSESFKDTKKLKEVLKKFY